MRACHRQHRVIGGGEWWHDRRRCRHHLGMGAVDRMAGHHHAAQRVALGEDADRMALVVGDDDGADPGLTMVCIASRSASSGDADHVGRRKAASGVSSAGRHCAGRTDSIWRALSRPATWSRTKRLNRTGQQHAKSRRWRDARPDLPHRAIDVDRGTLRRHCGKRKALSRLEVVQRLVGQIHVSCQARLHLPRLDDEQVGRHLGRRHDEAAAGDVERRQPGNQRLEGEGTHVPERCMLAQESEEFFAGFGSHGVSLISNVHVESGFQPLLQ
jgi:hypothetical protein